MLYYIKQKVFTIGDRYTIKDAAENDLFLVEGRIFTLGAKLQLFDMDRNECAYIEQELFHLLPRYNIYRDGLLLAQVKKEFTFFKSRYSIEAGTGSYTVSGDFWSMDFVIEHDGRPAATIHKKWLSWGDSYQIDIADTEDIPLMLSIVIIIDNTLHQNGQAAVIGSN